MRERIDSDLLDDIQDYLDDRADASAEGDPAEYRPNEAMQLLQLLRRERQEDDV